MITLVTGGSGSGKSAYAESLLSSCEGIRYYIATMQIYDAEGEKKVERHRKLRAGKGFLTIESPMNVGKIRFAMCRRSRAGAIQAGDREKSAGQLRKEMALLECMSNLTANEMFTKDGMKSEEEVVEKIVSEIQTLSQKLDNLVIVTNNVFEDGVIYDAGTMEYLRALGRINAALARTGRPGGRGRGRNSGGTERMKL